MDVTPAERSSLSKKKRNFPLLPLNDSTETLNFLESESAQPILVIQSPKTPTLSRKLKAVSLDSDAGQKKSLEVSRDVSSVPNTPKKHVKKETHEFDGAQKTTLMPHLGSNLKRFASNQSISGSQTLKTLPEIMTLQDFSGAKTEPVRIKAKGLLERRGSNASLTIDLGSNTSLAETKPQLPRLNTAKSVSNLNLTSFGFEKCFCSNRCLNRTEEVEIKSETYKKLQNHTESCENCTIYESVPSSSNKPATKHDTPCKCNLKFLPRYYIERHCVCNLKYRRKSLSNENLYVPPCNFCHFGTKECYTGIKVCNRGSRKALYPRQTYIETSQLLSEDFKLHLQNIQYLQTAGSVLSVGDLKLSCQSEKLPRLHQEFWEIPLNLQEKCLVPGSQSRNRYKGVLPNEHSRVHIPTSNTYIHANFIKGADYTETAYIATQGPMSHTCEDFWNMIWSNRVKCVVMLTALVERGRSKCELYFPLGCDNKPNTPTKSGKIRRHLQHQVINDSSDEEITEEVESKDSISFGPFTIKYISKDNLGECEIRTLEVVKSDSVANPPRRLLHYWYSNWADHKQANPEQVLHIALHVLGITNSKASSLSDSSSFDITYDSSSSVEVIPDLTGLKLGNEGAKVVASRDGSVDVFPDLPGNLRNGDVNVQASETEFVPSTNKFIDSIERAAVNNKYITSKSVDNNVSNAEMFNSNRSCHAAEPNLIFLSKNTSDLGSHNKTVEANTKLIDGMNKDNRKLRDQHTNKSSVFNFENINVRDISPPNLKSFNHSISLDTHSTNLLISPDTTNFLRKTPKGSVSSVQSCPRSFDFDASAFERNLTPPISDPKLRYGPHLKLDAIRDFKSAEDLLPFDVRLVGSELETRSNLDIPTECLNLSADLVKSNRLVKSFDLGSSFECVKDATVESGTKNEVFTFDRGDTKTDDKRTKDLVFDKSKFSYDNLAKIVQRHGRNPVVVHCSAGIGRTGCFLAILNGIQQLKMNYNVDVLAIVCSLRLNRGGMVQTAEQYELIHRVLSLYADLL